MKAGNDDAYLLGPPEAVFPALEEYSRKIRERCGLSLQRQKTEVFCWGDLPPQTPADMRRAGIRVGEEFAPGLEVYGIGVGSDEYVQEYLGKKVKEIGEVVLRSCDLLEPDLQAKWTLLSSSVSQKLSYHLALQYPTDIAAAAERLDSILWGMLEEATGLHIPRAEEGLGVECVVAPPVRGLEEQSFQAHLVRLPVRLGGLGLRSLVDTSPAAFLGSVEMTLPHFGGGKRVVPAPGASPWRSAQGF